MKINCAVLLPPQVEETLRHLEGGGFAAWVVGGAVRDSLLCREPRDWDVATSAHPEEVLRVFPSARPTGLEYGTVTVPVEGWSDGVEVTTFRSDGPYLDGRHPSAVAFTEAVETDLARRDFTMNALAYHPARGLLDLYGGSLDLRLGRLRTVGDAGQRFREDALRSLRACRFAAELGLRPDKALLSAARATAPLFARISPERKRDELVKLLLAPDPARGLRLLRVSGLLPDLLPELTPTYGLRQSGKHAYSVWTHTLKVVGAVPAKPELRLAALFHDTGKPGTREEDPRGEPCFPGHDRRSAELAAGALRRLAFPRALVDQVSLLVAEHMFRWTPADGAAGLRRLLARVGPENLAALLAIRRADLLSLRPVTPGDHRLRLLEELATAVREVLASHPPYRRADLAVSGEDLIAAFHLKSGPVLGRLLDRLLDEILTDPALNTRDELLRRAALHLHVGDQPALEVGRIVEAGQDRPSVPPGKDG